MEIKRVEIKGFKSFPDKTVLELKPGIACIVGPNGCGKSNVFEAIRWVMGEQRVRSLRGKKMEDVIFNGSDNRKPLGMAEVRLVLSNTGSSKHPAMEDYDEIMITRRLFRDGTSQYEINNIGCRLADVVDFFLDTGVGKNSYAVIEQGRVDMVVNSKPEDRRVLIEEAAGISRYKARRHAAVKKLEQTRQNLDRISDIVGEVKRQSSSLKRQAAKAERYRQLSDRLKELDLSLHAAKCRELQDRLTSVDAELVASREALAEKESSASSLHAQLEAERLKSLQTERALKDLLELRHQTDLDLTGLRSKLDNDEARLPEIAKLRDSARTELKLIQEKRDASSARVQERAHDELVLGEELTTAQQELREALEEIQAVTNAIREKTGLQDSLKDEVFRILQETAQKRNERDTLTKRRNEIQLQQDKLTKEQRELSQFLAEDRDEHDRLEHEIRETQESRAEAGRQKQNLTARKNDCTKTIAELRKRLSEREQALAAANAKLESLREQQRSFTGYGESVRVLMQDDEIKSSLRLLGPLAEIVDVPPEYQKAVAAALGERLGHLVVESPLHGAAASRHLRETGSGRSTFTPLAPRSQKSDECGELPAGLKPLKECARFREGFEELADFLVGRCYLVDDIGTAVEIWEQNGIAVDLVTSEGELLNRHGEITGGSRDQIKDQVFDTRRQIEESQEHTARITTEVDTVKRDLAASEQEDRNLAHDIQECDEALGELSIRLEGTGKDLSAAASRIASGEKRVKVLDLEKERLDKERDGLTQRIGETDEQITHLEGEHADAETKLATAREEAEQFRSSVKDKTERSEELKVELGRLEERTSALKRERRTAEEELHGLEEHLTALKARIDEHDRSEKELAERIAQAKTQESELMRHHEKQAAELEELKTASADLSRSVESLERESAQATEAVKDIGKTAHELEMESVRLSQSLSAVVERMMDRYQTDPKTVTPTEEPVDESELAEIRDKLEAMGEVNLAAIAESRSTEERLGFLLEQETDLKNAVESLYETIDKINQTTKERFLSAFRSINEKFQEIFPDLFRGGEARLEMTDEDNLLETGIEIMARPPGKRIRNMDLLSGGEKALTAVALIFSIFLIRPSPFCLLDEVDAPLDDSNIVRFNDMLKKLSNRTQFLVVSHNKRSMVSADTLYGVTMEEPGVSTVVSVEFIE
jgi:chromosome segregation protein